MADLSKIKLNGTEYNFKDTVARDKVKILTISNINWEETSFSYSNLTKEEIIAANNNNNPIFINLDGVLCSTSVMVEDDSIYLYCLYDVCEYIFTLVTDTTGFFEEVHIQNPRNISSFYNDSGYLTSYTETDPTVPAWAKAETKPTYTYTEVGAAASSHTHGSITNAGAITSNTALANGDRLVFSDNSDSGLLKRASITIGNSTTQYLANNGTWQTLPTVSVSQTLTSGTEIGSVNNTKLYAPTPYDDTALAARVTALENLEWATYYSGRSNPSSAQGQNGDIYLQY